ncbi:transcription-repair coupling factor [Pelagicoccus sp. SDUM812003]|uniref:transcription-repair coupling factor n=1 Tax=Pelagicoccus sp. SDUM812003 TaxID=3041267 RepID=UPI0028102761|nr:transcription-repair coupling factor [Pelagicoccus sp. SDUM812003]MDQ8205308.1 transcription-repair coupling factor [Pelagicoccus sp. SDUM812003]
MSQRASVLLPSGLERWEQRIGVNDEAIAPIVEDWIHASNRPVFIVIAKNDRIAEQLRADLEYFHRKVRGDSTATRFLYFPEEQEFDDNDSPSERFEIGSERIATLAALQNAPEKSVVTASLKSLTQPVPSPSALQRSQLVLTVGETHSFEGLVETLQSIDYDAEGLCEAPGQFARRGGLIDVYPTSADKPYRIDFFGDEIDAIKELDPVTQRSGASVQSIVIDAAPSLQMEDAKNGFAEYLKAEVAWGIIEPDQIMELFDSALEQASGNELGKAWVALRDNRSKANDLWSTFSDLDLATDADQSAESFVYEGETLTYYRPIADSGKFADERLADEQSARIHFLEQALKWQKNGERLFAVLPNESDFKRVQEILQESESLKQLKLEFWKGDLNQGFRFHFRPQLERLNWPLLKAAKGCVLITETELFGRRRHRKPPTRERALVSQSQVDQLLDFAELVDGEFVVHLQHGIALYRGITKVDMQGQMREVLSLEFDDNVVLHVPLQESHLISRYVGISKTRPKLGKIGSNRWAKTREAAERATLDLAAKLLELQAKRDSGGGHAFGNDTEWQLEFENAFPFKETPDQLKAIEASKADMEKPTPMDRLICGDVGFGKTEVAIRAAFKAVMDGKQVALLVPTTVLAQQHFLNFRDRMASYPIVVELVSRFRKPAEIKKILASVAAGKVDILIGTHRILQKDVSFKDLGLAIIDEEQRFGLKHKEVFKEWRATVDILTMSATPIPRTLYMALTGARELSVIETAPVERKPIQTIVKSYDDALVAEVIRREISRGGQVFYLHNRVQTIDTVAARLSQLVPEVSIGVGHGQMDEKRLERVMLDFVNQQYQVLVCTTIIESGLDIPNCNTIIIEGADRFGLSQLYQLRGRVGRFKRQAFAYLLLHKHKRLVDVARKRLQAIRQHNQLGAGFRLAMRDLELRGAGNLLGSEQSGHIVGVGFELYCQLLRQSISRLKGEASAMSIRANVKLDFIYQGEGDMTSANRHEDGYTVLKRLDLKEGECPPMQARIPATYISETRLRIDIYRRLALAETPAEAREQGTALVDRFGNYPPEVEALLKLTEIRCLAEQKGVHSVESQGNRLKCRRYRGKTSEYIKLGSRFPRLRSTNALKRLNEIIVFLNNLVSNPS